ncbi:flagellar hook-basal body protein [Candidatus Desulforudis audaxviator]|uniref:Flagellar basal body rod protein n=1 Tax=Desulforudis audaxviator (strain MP104C) TaxID=477974 RepID=B1I5J1_DESAP|nr:flagellar hook-basal body protein [Candidatus Desulforudis audaxviator]ACA60238.1 flagellar basal body rod protein [Candidatus Desulforudis audaxviator MP104C]AZK60287.1 Flagellar basal-body rod protein FlgF [Candidatus Desulforudis audaxviator]
MIRGVYTAASGMLAGQTRLDAVAHNIANVNTTGFRRQVPVFAPYLQTAVGRHEKRVTPIGTTSLGTVPTALVTDLTGGPVVQTGRTMDLALEGEGFFTVEREGQQLYTRAGSFKVDASGILVTRAGDPVLGERGPLKVGHDGFTVSADGRVFSSTGEELDRLRLTALPGRETWVRTPDGYLMTGEATAPAINTRVHQGYLEGSNVHLAVELVDLLLASRLYAANQRVARTQDTLVEKAINQVGALR